MYGLEFINTQTQYGRKLFIFSFLYLFSLLPPFIFPPPVYSLTSIYSLSVPLVFLFSILFFFWSILILKSSRSAAAVSEKTEDATEAVMLFTQIYCS